MVQIVPSQEIHRYGARAVWQDGLQTIAYCRRCKGARNFLYLAAYRLGKQSQDPMIRMSLIQRRYRSYRVE